MVTVAGLRRSGGVDGRSVHFRTHCIPRTAADRTGPERGGDHGLAGGRDHGLAGGRDDVDVGAGWDGVRSGCKQWIGTDEVFGVRVHDDEPRSVQDACDETSTSQVAVRPLQRQLYTPVRSPSSSVGFWLAKACL